MIYVIQNLVLLLLVATISAKYGQMGIKYKQNKTKLQTMAAWAIINKQGKILMIRRSQKTSRSGQWCFPGGGVKDKETPAQACIREVSEETGLAVILQQCVAVIDDSYYFSCQLADEAAQIKLKYNECDDFVWVKPDDVLSVGQIMALKELTAVFALIGHDIESVPNIQSLG